MVRNIDCARASRRGHECHHRRSPSGERHSSDVGFDLELSVYGVNLAAVANTAPSQPPFVSLGVAATPENDFELQLIDTTDGRLYLIESSEDLGTWVPFSYEFVRGGSIDIPTAISGPQQFYRARWMPSVP
jgi:hypothetical protein